MREILLVAALPLVALPSTAACRFDWVCDAMGQCETAQICDSSIDLPALETPSLPPLAPPRLEPLPSPTLPPLGTSSCKPLRVWDDGADEWVTLCQ